MNELATESKSRFLVPVMMAVALTALAAGVWLGSRDTQSGRSVATNVATVLVPAQPISDFALVDHHGRPFTKSAFTGHWTFLFFGYTHCPDVCPTTLHVLDQVDRGLDAHRDTPTQFVFVSVDPSRDTPDSLADYVAYFNSRFLGVTGEMQAIENLTRQLGILHLRTERNDGAAYLVDHSTSVLLVDPDASLRAIFAAPHHAEPMIADFLKIKDRRS